MYFYVNAPAPVDNHHRPTLGGSPHHFGRESRDLRHPFSCGFTPMAEGRQSLLGHHPCFAGSSNGQQRRGQRKGGHGRGYHAGRFFANQNVTLCDTGDAIQMTMDVPGVKAENLKVEVDGGTILKVSGKRTVATQVAREFTRRFVLSDEINVEQMKANLADGVLTIALPKQKKEEPQSIAIPVTENLVQDEGEEENEPGKVGDAKHGKDGVTVTTVNEREEEADEEDFTMITSDN